MTAGQRVIVRPSFQGQTAALVLASTFAVGVVTGLVMPLVHLAPAQQAANQVIASQVGDPIWQTYRQGERSSVQATGSTVSSIDAWRIYRRDERGDRTP